jgi:hypothetical protein
LQSSLLSGLPINPSGRSIKRDLDDGLMGKNRGRAAKQRPTQAPTMPSTTTQEKYHEGSNHQ